MDQFVRACHGYAIDFGMMKNDKHLVIYKDATASRTGTWPVLSIESQRNDFDILASIHDHRGQYEYRFRQKLAQIEGVHEIEVDGGLDVVINMKLPPQVHRRKNAYESWRRQTTIPGPGLKETGPVSMLSECAIMEPGRWFAYRVHLRDLVHRNEWKVLTTALHMIPRIIGDLTVTISPPSKQWGWLYNTSQSQVTTYSDLAMLHLADSQIHLPYNIMYQLEVCISQGYLREPNLDHIFALKLQALDHETGIPGMTQSLLEHIAGLKKHFSNPMDIFKYQHEVKVSKPTAPSYCITLQSATVTPTTIYFNTPATEMSNRVLRKYNQYDRHFLRVKFRDENHLGRARAYGDGTDDAMFQRFERILKQGITVGGRTFEFLAYGNSQLRENGAYFFAPTQELSAEELRQQIGSFAEIKVVAKYAARLGQAFSSTRTSWNKVDIVNIPDIERNGYCFSDGVGKMSSFVARMIAEHLKIPSTMLLCPSAFQFRLGGYKGIIVVDPKLTGRTLHLRPSQNKFPADHSGLEICKAAQYSATFLNQQLVLILSCLGLPDEVLIKRQTDMLAELHVAMQDQHMAVKLLLKCVDQARTTETLANMIQDGFMRTQEPFFMNCLRLWLSWSVKWVKEKARILIPEGAFVLGCVDETGLLSGHHNKHKQQDVATLPKIFLQTLTIDPTNRSVSILKIVKGLCIVARNPSLHPGDIRVVEAIDVPELHHLRNMVVFPQTGDRDIPGMCSGGDLDGDDFLVIWDPDMIPPEWNHAPMDYTPPAPKLRNGTITVDDITSFFVEYMKNNNLGRIATAHRYWADLKDEGPKHKFCLQLAALHSRAVDYGKTGVPAQMERHLVVQKWPRWAGNGRVAPSRIYDSDKILHRLYRGVDFVDFNPAHEFNFDSRILEACQPDDEVLKSVRSIKRDYDAALLRIMSKHEIKLEYEVWSAFVLEHNQDIADYTLQEALESSMRTIKQQFRQAVFDAAGTKEMDQENTKKYIVAMYRVTAEEVAEGRDSDGGEGQVLMSFPWVFQRELGLIANDQYGAARETGGASPASMVPLPKVAQPAESVSLAEVAQPAEAVGIVKVAHLAEMGCSAGSARVAESDELAEESSDDENDPPKPNVFDRAIGL